MQRRGLSPKTQQKCEGHYTVIKKPNDVGYRVERSPNFKPKVIHINRLEPYWTTDRSCLWREFGRNMESMSWSMKHSIQKQSSRFKKFLLIFATIIMKIESMGNKET
ncbi:hypothetical protein AVEN_77832-1 [Araneus ventricosus]|uniref:Integrase p58-like C-terminal domain-containing protein n=1 Tax=Araneus ventricosus TaxID=182803 RepID=A0A4Y2GNY8_ARAVE|nr:hypothetical protein AVEN_77832-1 [Araneus ventricosus]